MLCERCHGQSASVHLVQIINGEKTELHLCSECAQKDTQLNNNDIFFEEFLQSGIKNGFMNMFPYYIQAYSNKGGRNVYSGPKHAKGILNGTQTYESFREELKTLFSDKNKDTNSPDGLFIHEDEQLTELEKKLSECIKLEKFEEAAKLRDQIQAYKNRNKM